jgi:hypothetical protein
MIQHLLWHIAGVDRATLATCPVTDKVWAAHLGFSLVLSFTVVLGISFHATGYVIADPWVRLLAAIVVALTVFMFDRALYQSDWFYQGILQRGFDPANPDDRPDRWRPLRRFFRITIRLTISFALAWIIAVFLELAIFSDTISEKVKRDHLAGNQPIFQKIEGYEAQLDREIEQRRQQLVAAEALYRRELGTAQPPEAAPPAQLDELEQQIKGLDAQEQELRGELRQLQGKITGYAEEMNAEEVGRKLNPNSSGRAGAGPRYTFAKQQRDVYTAQRAERERELRELAARREELRSTQGRIAADAAARRNQAREAVASQRGALEAQVDVARRELAALEAARLAKVAEFRSQALAASDFQKLKDDPLSRMTAYQELKSDPKDGATITLFSWMTKFLVIFLEIVPVVAKMFFSPPSVYAARIQAMVFRGREEAFRSPPEPAPSPVSEPEPRWPPVEVVQLARKLDERPRPDLWPPARAAGTDHASSIADLRPPAGSGTEDPRNVSELKSPEPDRTEAPPTLLRPKSDLRPPPRPQAQPATEDLKSLTEFNFREPERTEAPLKPLTLQVDIFEKP